MGAYSFDGVDDKIQYPDSAAMDALNLSEYLVLVWVRPGTGGNNNGRICGRTDNTAGTTGHIQLLIGNGTNGTRNGNFSARQRTTGNLGQAASATGIVPDSAWSLIGGHYEDAGSGSRWRIFEAGAEVTPANTNSATGTIDNESEHPYVLGNEQSGGRPYHGHIAYLGIWDVSTLTNTQIDTLVSDFYNGGTGTANVPQQSLLVEFLRLDTNGATTGDKNVLTSPSITGAAFDSGNSPPVTYNALGGGTPVSREWAVSYDIANAISREWVVSYDIANAVSREWQLAYDIANAISRDWQLAYDIANAISREWQLSYDLTSNINREWQLSYDILNAISREWALSYNLGDVVQPDIAEWIMLRRGVWQPDVYTLGRR